MTGSHRLMMGLGFHGLSHWRKPGVEEALVEPALGAELRRASTHIILNMPADHIGHDATGLPANCPTRYVLSAPSYSGRLAFIDRDYFCSLCGSGATLAMKYDGREWQLVAIHGSWVS
ncbi:MAG: hypothetical protein JWM65_3176 [Sphingomonas bacterium]|nr:hypothetical protein [Sphingomonas bacterium]